MLINVETKQNDINPIQILEDDNTFAAVLELGGIILECVSFLHARTDIEGTAHGCDLTDIDLTSSIMNNLGCFLQRDALKYSKMKQSRGKG